MKLASSFTIPAAADKVMTLFLDPTTMRSCIPGCEDLVQTDETHYKGSLVNEVAHVRFKAGFAAEITSMTRPEDTSKPTVVKAVLRGEDRRLGSTIRIDATLTVTPLAAGDGGETGEVSEVSYEFELGIRGKLGRVGEAVVRKRTAEVEKHFAEALTAICTGRPVPQSGKVAAGKKAATPVLRAVPTPQSADVEGAPAGFPQPQEAGAVQFVAAPAAERPRQDWFVLALAVAAAFAYGILFGRRKGDRR
ncbi:SRPBCC domain-containing protein [Streptomyces canus]|uniref:CoxG family protein n=1 Tax=Streptomyces canus TaxID=58343 RepID=UPI002E2BF22B|nr:SRPBCC domain-containing protein [Streptomyces canus]